MRTSTSSSRRSIASSTSASDAGDIVGTYAGMRPLVGDPGGSTVKASREHRVAADASGLVRISGGKYTTYRVMARDVVDASLGSHGGAPAPVRDGGPAAGRRRAAVGARPDRREPGAAASGRGGGPRRDARHVARARRACGSPTATGARRSSVHVAGPRARPRDAARPGRRPPPGRGRVGGAPASSRSEPRRRPRPPDAPRAGAARPRRGDRAAASPRSSARSSAGTRRARPPRSSATSRRRAASTACRGRADPARTGPRVEPRQMADDRLILALDQGTTSSRAIAFGRDGRPVAMAQQAFEQQFPSPGHVTHDPETIWSSQLAVAQQVVREVGGADRIAAIGITNQRETTIVWDRATGEPIADAIVWQIADHGAGLRAPAARRARGAVPRADGAAARRVLQRAQDRGDPRRRARRSRPCRARRARLRHRGHLPALAADGRRCGGRRRPRDRRLERQPDPAVRHPSPRLGRRAARARRRARARCCPEVRPTSGPFGETAAGALRPADPDRRARRRPAGGDCSARRASRPGRRRTRTGPARSCCSTPAPRRASRARPPHDGRLAARAGGPATYALEGSVFSAGAAVQWLRDGLGLIDRGADVEALAAAVDDAGGVYLVPGVHRARGAVLGSRRARHDRRAHARHDAARTSPARRSNRSPSRSPTSSRRWPRTPARAARRSGSTAAPRPTTCCSSSRPTCSACRSSARVVAETTALGAAYLAGLAVGYWSDSAEIAANWALDRRFEPSMSDDRRRSMLDGWHRAVDRSLGWAVADRKPQWIPGLGRFLRVVYAPHRPMSRHGRDGKYATTTSNRTPLTADARPERGSRAVEPRGVLLYSDKTSDLRGLWTAVRFHGIRAGLLRTAWLHRATPLPD